MELREILLKIGISSNLQGYHYILEAVNILKNQKIHTNISTIYEMIYKKFEVKSIGTIERAIRYSIKQAYKKTLLPQIYDGRPDNSAFLYDLVFNLDIFKSKC